VATFQNFKLIYEYSLFVAFQVTTVSCLSRLLFCLFD